MRARRAAAGDKEAMRRLGDEAYMERLRDGSARIVARHRNVIVTSDFQQSAARDWSDFLVTKGVVTGAEAAVHELS